VSEEEIAWRALGEKTAVVDAAGNEIGVTRRILADDQKDIFHGLAVKLHDGGRVVEIRADRIPRITRSRVYTTVETNEVDHLPAASG